MVFRACPNLPPDRAIGFPDPAPSESGRKTARFFGRILRGEDSVRMQVYARRSLLAFRDVKPQAPFMYCDPRQALVESGRRGAEAAGPARPPGLLVPPSVARQEGI